MLHSLLNQLFVQHHHQLFQLQQLHHQLPTPTMSKTMQVLAALHQIPNQCNKHKLRKILVHLLENARAERFDGKFFGEKTFEIFIF